jgi:dihydroxy-acid dehydratase
VVHLLAIAGRLNIRLTLDDFDRISRRTPCIANLKPSGQYVMEDFFHAGGLPAALRIVGNLLHSDALTVNGRSIHENIAEADCWNSDVIRPADRPIASEGGIAVLTGNLAPRGAVIKQSAASPELLTHTGRAFVFEDHDELVARIDSEDLPVDRDTVLVMKNGGPKGAPGFPEWGWIPMPRALLKRGIKDIVRISDARMSGTSFGTVVLHVAPETAAGGPLAMVQTGDDIRLDVPNRRVDLMIGASEWEARISRLRPAPRAPVRGYRKMYVEHVT